MDSPASSSGSKRWLVPVVTIVIMAAVAGLILSKRVWFYRHVHGSVEQRVDELLAGLRAHGAKVGEPQVLDDVVGVEQVVTLDINGKPIRLIEFDVSKEAAAKEIAHIHENHTTKILGAEQPAENEGVIVILDFDQHPDKAKILEAFHKKGAAGK